MLRKGTAMDGRTHPSADQGEALGSADEPTPSPAVGNGLGTDRPVKPVKVREGQGGSTRPDQRKRSERVPSGKDRVLVHLACKAGVVGSNPTGGSEKHQVRGPSVVARRGLRCLQHAFSTH